jgi:alpha-tubulin suppressor-like RCC1 family protein
VSPVVGWRNNASGQLGPAVEGQSRHYSPVIIGGESGYQEITGGWDHTIALDAAGNVWAWGGNNYGQLGIGSQANQREPVLVPGVSGIVDVVAGSHSSYALTADGRVFSWGRNTEGMLGIRTRTLWETSPKLVPVPPVVELEASPAHVIVRTASPSRRASSRRRVLAARRTVSGSPARDMMSGSYPWMDLLIAAMEVASLSTASRVKASSGPSR